MIKGLTYNLRLASLQDTDFILKLRTDNNLNKYIHKTDFNPEIHISWFKEYIKKDNDLYFIIQKNKGNFREGLISLYDINYELGTAELGRWILQKNSKAATESIFLLYDFTFDYMKLNEIHCKTVTKNKSVVKFHKHFGLEEQKEKIYHEIEGIPVPATLQIMKKELWKEKRQLMLPKLIKISKRVNG